VRLGDSEVRGQVDLAGLVKSLAVRGQSRHEDS
jgi:hypothetical protein